MSEPELTCRDERRRDQVRRHELNGLDYLEVDPEDPRRLTVTFLGKAPEHIKPANVRIDGGTRITGITVKEVRLCVEDDPDLDDCMRVLLDKSGDFSTYTLRLVKPDAHGRPGDELFDGFDRRYAALKFTFNAGCASDLDCLPEDICPPEPPVEPEINYLAKDYASFRQLILDRMALTMPEWKERLVPDIGIALVEVLAYAGDHLSYYQDAVATEAYLETARERISVRRHARLVDYRMHDGCNARAWVCVETSTPLTLKPDDFYFITGYNDALLTERVALIPEDLQGVSPGRYEVFEPVVQDPVAAEQPVIQLYPEHNRITFYTWGDRECCLPRGATRAWLRDGDPIKRHEEPPHEEPPYGKPTAYGSPYQGQEQRKPSEGSRYQGQEQQPPAYGSPYGKPPEPPRPPERRHLQLKAGDVLIFEEVKGPVTGERADADPTHRHAVRLTRVEPGFDDLYDQPFVEIEWAEEDALPFPLCISAIGRAPECEYIKNISVARGNVILVDHGRTIDRCGSRAPDSWEVPAPIEEDAGCEGVGDPREPTVRPALFRPRLRFGPLTFGVAFPQPAEIARRQAYRLGALRERVRERVRQLWRQARDGRALSAAEIAELSAIYGQRALAQAGLVVAGRGRRHPGSEEQARALRWLLARHDSLLAKKARRLAVLLQRARAGYMLTDAEVREVGELFGEQYAAGLGRSSADLFGAASAALRQDPREALPAIYLIERSEGGEPQPEPPTPEEQGARGRRSRGRAEAAEDAGEPIAERPPAPVWLPRLDLLASNGRDRYFVAEVENDGRARLRFGDDELGSTPTPGTTLVASYRVGNGAAGNVGAETISRIVFCDQTDDAITRVRNPLPARGGTDPEPLAEVKLFAPTAFRKELQRAVTGDDYARLAERNPGVQRAAASLHWTGGWYEVQVAIDPLGGVEAGEGLLREVYDSLYRYRRIGHDLRVTPARYVPLDIELHICVLPHYLRAHVKAVLLDLFGNRVLPSGQRGFFHPDNLSFGDSIYLSRLVAAAQAVPGVESVEVTRLQRLFEGADDELVTGVLPIGPLQIARLDSDRSMPENGKLDLILRGGR